MKKFYYLCVTLLTVVISLSQVSAQSMDQDQFSNPKEARKAAREAHRKAVAAENQLYFEQAVDALKAGSFVVEVDQLVFPRGIFQYKKTDQLKTDAHAKS